MEKRAGAEDEEGERFEREAGEKGLLHGGGSNEILVIPMAAATQRISFPSRPRH